MLKGFKEAWERELEIKASLRKNEISFVTVVENTINEGDKISTDLCDTIMKIRHEYCSPYEFS
jgi:hypothetical protein